MRNEILLVDDDREFREEFRHCFAEYDMTDVSCGEDALAVLKKPNEIGLVLLDVKMPGRSGTDILVEIKAASPDIAIIIMTGYSSESIAIDALKGHADDYIQKPFEIDELREKIERLLGAGSRKAVKKIDPVEDRVGRVKGFVERNCYKKVTLTDAARAVSLCPKYLSRLFKEATGAGFSEYRLKVQMGKAKELLAGGKLNVTQVSDKMGYKNPESFVRQFKKIVGSTPTEYRAKRRGAR